MDIQSRKIEFIQEFLKLQNEEILTRLEKLLKSNISSKESDFEPLTIAELNNRIDKSLKDSHADRMISSEDLLKEIDQWD